MYDEQELLQEAGGNKEDKSQVFLEYILNTYMPSYTVMNEEKEFF